MSFLDILLKRQREYVNNDNKRRKRIVPCILDIHRIFKKSGFPTLNYWGDREVEILHLAIMYVDVYLSSNDQSDIYDDLVVAAGCYSIAYKYETDTYETEFLEFLQHRTQIGNRNCSNLLKEVLAFEWILLKVMDWRVNLVTPVAFIREYANDIKIDPDDACKISLKLIILDVCILPSNWGTSSLILANTEAINYFNPSAKDLETFRSVREILAADWMIFKQENPNIKYVVKDCGSITNKKRN